MSPAPRELSYAQARELVLGSLGNLPATDAPIAACVRRALRRAVSAPHALPPFDNSAMDGWAVRASDAAGATPVALARLRVVGTSAAGHPFAGSIGPGDAALVMTGAPIPAGADTVVAFEDGERVREADGQEWAVLGTPPPRGSHIRRAGEDVAAGDVVLAAGRELSAHDVALAASLGHAHLHVSPVPRVAVLSTGDELLDPGDAARPGAIRDSNLPMLAALVRESGGDPVIAERLPDDAARVVARVREAVETCDLVLTIGGVSAGDFDPVKQALGELGEIELWRVAMRPGRPQAFGRPRGRVFFGLPGNPASVACVFEALVRPALRQLLGYAALDRPRVPVRLATDVESRAGRVDFVRCTLEWRLGALWAAPTGAQVSGHLGPQSRAHALLVVPGPADRLQRGDEAEALVWRLPDAP